MFGNIGWGECLVLLIAALVILGPERLPGAIGWVTKSLRQVREYASGASQQLKDELGPDFEDLRQPLSDLNQLRGMTPRSVITKHLLDGDDSFITDLTQKFDITPGKSVSVSKGGASSTEPAVSLDKGASAVSLDKAAPSLDKAAAVAKPSVGGDRPPIDYDAT